MTKRNLRLFLAAAVCLSVLTWIGVALVIRNLFFSDPSPSVSALTSSRLVFHDEFGGSTLDRAKWSTCYDWYDDVADGCSNYGNAEKEWYRAANVSVRGGSLLLTAEKRPVLGADAAGNPLVYPYRSGMVSTGRGENRTAARLNGYGYYEARIKTPSGQGIWPAFWLLPEGTQWPPEIDIMEQTGDKPADILMTYFWPNAATVSQKDSYTYTGPSSFAHEWHTYGLLWQKDRLTWYVDGTEIRHVRSGNIPRQRLALVLNLAVGGMLPGDPDASTRFPSVMAVDYVRVYSVS